MDQHTAIHAVPDQGQQKIRLTGEIVETFERDGTTVARVAVRSCWLELDTWALKTTQLGEMVILEAGLNTEFHTQHAETRKQPETS